MTVVAYGVDHGVDGVLNVVKGYGKPPTPPPPNARFSPKGANVCFPRFTIVLRIINNCSTTDRTAVSILFLSV